MNTSQKTLFSFCDRIKLSNDQKFILLLLEPPLNNDNTLNIPFIHGFKMYFVESSTEPIYAVMLTNIEGVFIDTRFSNPWCIVAHISLDDLEWVVSTAYLHREINIEEQIGHLYQIVQHYFSHPLILAMDTNSHSMAWGNTFNDPRGARLLEFIDSEHLRILNDCTSPTWASRGYFSVIDLFLANRKMRDLSWDIGDHIPCSDHIFTWVTIDIPASHVADLEFSKAPNWEIFDSIIPGELNNNFCQANLESRNDIDRALFNLTSSITETWKKSLQYIKKANHKNPWVVDTRSFN